MHCEVLYKVTWVQFSIIEGAIDLPKPAYLSCQRRAVYKEIVGNHGQLDGVSSLRHSGGGSVGEESIAVSHHRFDESTVVDRVYLGRDLNAFRLDDKKRQRRFVAYFGA